MNKKHTGSTFRSLLEELGEDMIDPHASNRRHDPDCPCDLDASIPEDECICYAEDQESEEMMGHQMSCPKYSDIDAECSCYQMEQFVESHTKLDESLECLNFDKFMDNIVINEAKNIKTSAIETPQRKHARMYREKFQNSIRFGRTK